MLIANSKRECEGAPNKSMKVFAIGLGRLFNIWHVTPDAGWYDWESLGKPNLVWQDGFTPPPEAIKVNE